MQVLCVHCVIILYHGGILPFAFHDTLPQAFVSVHFCEYVCLSVLFACAGACSGAGAGASPVHCICRCSSVIAYM